VAFGVHEIRRPSAASKEKLDCRHRRADNVGILGWKIWLLSLEMIAVDSDIGGRALAVRSFRAPNCPSFKFAPQAEPVSYLKSV
jgi:hypothetical protein